MCMPTNFGNRKKYSSKFQRSKKKNNKKDEFFCDANKFLEEKKDESISIKS